MRISTIVAGLVTMALCAAAFWADGSDPGGLIVSAATIGLAVFFQARNVEGGWQQAGIAAVYLACIALVSVSALLIDKALGAVPSANLLKGSSAIPGAILGWAICSTLLRRGSAPQ